MQVNQPSIAQLEQAVTSGNETATLQLGNRLINENPPNTAPCQRGLELLRKAATGSQAAAAQWLLGAFYLHNLSLPDSVTLAAEWLQQATKSRVGLALDRMANLYLRGLGVDYQPQQALDLLRQLADAGLPHSAWECGYLTSTLNEVADSQASATAFARACALGYAPAFYSLGLRFGYGTGMKQDPAFARALLLYAADAGIHDARTAADELAPVDQFGEKASSWLIRLKKNHTDTSTLRQQLSSGFIVPDTRNPVIDHLEAHFVNVDHPSLCLSGTGRLEVKTTNDKIFHATPSEWDWLSKRPRVATCSTFLTREERSQILRTVDGAMMSPQQYAIHGLRGDAESQFFNGTAMAFGSLNSNTIIRCIERRVAALTDWDTGSLDPCSVISYKPGQEYQPHVDYFEEQQIATLRDQMRDYGGQRIVTFLICLQAAERGGDTVYPDADVAVTYATGSAMLHYNVLPDGSPDKLSLHHGWPVEAGEKWLLRTTLREYPRYRT